MSWVKLDDKFTEHPKLISVGPLGIALQVAALCYSNTHLTDGFISFNVVQKLLFFEFSPPGDDTIYTIGITSGMQGQDVDCRLVAGWLVSGGIWEEAPGGYQIHDYSDYQPLKAEVIAEREKAQVRMNKRRSEEVRANNGRTTGEVPAKFNDPVPVPVPVPVPEEEKNNTHNVVLSRLDVLIGCPVGGQSDIDTADEMLLEFGDDRFKKAAGWVKEKHITPMRSALRAMNTSLRNGGFQQENKSGSNGNSYQDLLSAYQEAGIEPPHE